METEARSQPLTELAVSITDYKIEPHFQLEERLLRGRLQAAPPLQGTSAHHGE